MASVNTKWFVLAIVLGVAAVCLVTVFWTGMLFPRKVEKISFLSCDWSSDPPAVVLNIASTGADELIVDKVWINGTLIDSLQWEIFPSMRLKPGDQGALHITMPEVLLTEGAVAYRFTIATTAGNLFSHTAVPEQQFTFMKTEELKVQGHTWGTNQIQLTVKNTGTSALTLSEARVNDAVATATFNPAKLDPGATSTVTISQTFTSGVKYEFAVLTATGNKYTYIATAP